MRIGIVIDAACDLPVEYTRQHDLIVLLIQLVIGFGVLFIAGNMAWNAVGPIIKQQMAKPANG